MELPPWLPLDQCMRCVRAVKHGCTGEENLLEDQHAAAVVSEYFETAQQKAKLASRLWGLRAADAARGGHGGVQKPEAQQKRRRRGEVTLEVGLPNINQFYKWGKDKLGSLKLVIHRESKQRRACLQLAKSTVISCHPNADSNLGKEVKERLRTLLMIDHVNVLALQEACEDSRWLYLIYDWPEGGLLLDYLTHSHEEITEGHLASIFREVLGALAAANRFNIHHLDWSLLCCFLSYENAFTPVKVFGLGLAAFFVPLVITRNVSKSRKHFYVAPELLADKFASMNHKQLHACDIWSLGTLLYMLFSGRPPFCSSNTEEVCEMIRQGVWTFGHEFDIASRAVKDIIQAMLIRKWETRPSAGDLLKHSFMQIQVGQHKKKQGLICQDALEKLRQFSHETHCKQTLSRLMADLGVQEHLYSDLERKFKQLDLDGDGVVEIPELLEVAGTVEGLDYEIIESIIATCDRNGNSTIDISEFMSAAVLKIQNNDEKLLMKAFDRVDINRDGRLTKGEIFRVLRQYSGNLDIADVSAFVSDVDKDNDCRVDYAEFKKSLFPNMKPEDESVKGRMKVVKAARAEKKKQFRELQHRSEKFMSDLRTLAGKLTFEHEKMMKSEHVHGRAVTEKVGETVELVRWFAGKSQACERRADKDRKEAKQMMTGLSVMNQYKKVCAETTPAMQRSGSASETLPSPKDPGTPTGAIGDLEAVVPRYPDSNGPESDVANRTIAETYIAKSATCRGMTLMQFKEEANRRRKHLWQGGGEGMVNLRAAINNRPEDFLYKSGKRGFGAHSRAPSDGEESADGIRSLPLSPPLSPPQTPPLSPHGETPTGAAASRHNSESLAAGGSLILGRESSGGRAEAAAGKPAEGMTPQGTPQGTPQTTPQGSTPQGRPLAMASARSLESRTSSVRNLAGHPSVSQTKLDRVEEQFPARIDEGTTDFPIIPWTTKDKRLKSAEGAMLLASGPALQKIGMLMEKEKKEQLQNITKHLLQEYHLQKYTPDDMSDLHKLVRCKCARSWLPPLMLLHQEMESTLDESRGSAQDRRAVFRDGVRFCLQSCERIMFSLTEYLVWQEEGFEATWSQEEWVAMPPTSKRFLPYRLGEDDVATRTPRDEQDAEAIAQEAKAAAKEADNTKDGWDDSSDEDEEPGSMALVPVGLDTGAMPDANLHPRMDRNLVRIKKGKQDSKNAEKLHEAVLQAKHEAVAGNATLFFE